MVFKNPVGFSKLLKELLHDMRNKLSQINNIQQTMPMKLGYRKRFRKYKRKYPKFKPSKTFTAKVKKVMNLQLEKKHFTVSSGGFQTVSDTGTVTSISNVTQADTDTGRDGDQLYIRSLELQWQCDVIDTYNTMRIIIFQWYQNDSTSTPAVGDILQTLSNSSGVISPYNHDQRFNYRILYDKVVTLTQGNTDASYVYKSMITKFPKRKMQFNAADTTGTNKLYILKISDSSATSHPQVRNITKLNFSDP